MTLDLKLQNCKECRFWDWEVNVYDKEKGYGKFGAHAFSKEPKIMVVGQNPSKRREPYPNNFSMSGPQGKIFREIFGDENLILTNLVQISTPDNKIDLEDAAHGFWHLADEVDYYKPDVIIALGAFCRKLLTATVWHNVVYLKHPDYYLSYNKSDIEEYKKRIRSIKKTWETKFDDIDF